METRSRAYVLACRREPMAAGDASCGYMQSRCAGSEEQIQQKRRRMHFKSRIARWPWEEAWRSEDMAEQQPIVRQPRLADKHCVRRVHRDRNIRYYLGDAR